MDYLGRIKQLQAILADEDLDGLYVSNLVNVRYLCGFTGSSGALLVGHSDAWFLTDGRYRTQSGQEVAAAQIRIYGLADEQEAETRSAAGELGGRRVGFEADHLPYATAEDIRPWFEASELVPTKGLVGRLRRRKDSDEQVFIKEAARIADEAFEYVLSRIEAGRTEKELALELEFKLQELGGEDLSFKAIVAAAERSALPHATAGERRVEKGRYLLFDLGCRYRGYCSDLTRTVAVGSVDDRHREIYDIVAAAQTAGLEAVFPGRPAAQVDAAARGRIEAAGYGEAFGHGLGHGVGLDVHEAPYLRRTGKEDLSEGDVVTIEPGIYIPGWGGVRIEDLVLVTADGSEVLSKAPKDLVVI